MNARNELPWISLLHCGLGAVADCFVVSLDTIDRNRVCCVAQYVAVKGRVLKTDAPN